MAMRHLVNLTGSGQSDLGAAQRRPLAQCTGEKYLRSTTGSSDPDPLVEVTGLEAASSYLSEHA